MPKPKRMADCHSDRPHIAHGLCQQCYHKKYYIENRERICKRVSIWLKENKDHVRKYWKENRERILEQRRQSWQKNYNNRNDRANLKYKYGITLEEYDEMLEAQSNGCAICGKTPEENNKRLSVDHDHKTGKVRGLLCVTCNSLLGYAYDNIDILLSAIEYLR